MVALGGDDTRAIHAKLKPIVDTPILLRPLAYFFVPTFDAYFDADSSHRLLKFEGPLGPPGGELTLHHERTHVGLVAAAATDEDAAVYEG